MRRHWQGSLDGCSKTPNWRARSRRLASGAFRISSRSSRLSISSNRFWQTLVAASTSDGGTVIAKQAGTVPEAEVDRPDIPIVIVSWNTHGLLKDCLASVLRDIR